MTATSAASLWEEVRDSFTYDDGSLPTFEIHNLTQQEVGDLYGAIRKVTRIATEKAMFWDLTSKQEHPLDEVENAGTLVATGKSAPFHFAVNWIGGPGCSMRCIGVHLFQDSIALDYKMGEGWGQEEVWHFFVWLRDLMSLTSAGMVRLGDERPPAGDELIAAFGAFLKNAESKG